MYGHGHNGGTEMSMPDNKNSRQTAAVFLSQIAFQQFAFGIGAQAADGFFLDLAYPFAGKPEFVANLFQCHFLAADAEEADDDFLFPFVEGIQCAVDFL